MTVARLASIQRDLGLDVVVHGDPGRPGGVAPRAVMAHWTASVASASRPAPTLGMVRNGVSGLAGPLYGDLVDFNGTVHLITIGRHNHAGMGQLAALDSVAAGRYTPRRPGADTHGLNGLCVGVSADYHPNQGSPPAAQLEAVALAIRARLIYHGLPAHAVTDHAQMTRRKIDLLQHWPTPDRWRQLAAQPSLIVPEEDDMKPKDLYDSHVPGTKESFALHTRHTLIHLRFLRSSAIPAMFDAIDEAVKAAEAAARGDSTGAQKCVANAKEIAAEVRRELHKALE